MSDGEKKMTEAKIETFHVQFRDSFGVWIDEPMRGRTREDARRTARFSRKRIGRDGGDFRNFAGGFVAVSVRVVPDTVAGSVL